MQEEQHQWLLNEQKRKFLDGERITGEMFLEITGRDGFDIHIRTKGTFNRHVRGIDRTAPSVSGNQGLPDSGLYRMP